MKKQGRNYTTGERAIIYTSIAGGLALCEVNQELDLYQQKQGMSPRRLPESSYNMIKKKYIPKIGLSGLWKQISSPKSMSDLE